MFSKDSQRSYSPVGVHRKAESMKRYLVCGAVLVTIVFVWYLAAGGSASGRNDLNIATWNIAAINNNPFEYWITHNDPAYNNMMDAVQNYIEKPGSGDIPVSQVFTQEMFDVLAENMEAVGWSGVDETREQYANNFKDRKIISEFMKDSELGLKRLASMPDRTTNTVNLADGSMAYRPTVINCYDNQIKDLQAWFQQWLFFMFKQRMKIPDKNVDGGVVEKSGYELLVPIKRSKYPALTEAEETISIPLQTMCGAIFDAILVQIVMVRLPLCPLCLVC